MVRLSALHTGRLYPQGNIPGTHLCWELSRSEGHSAVGKIMSMKNSNDTIGNRTRDLPACSAVPQPTAPPRETCKRVEKVYKEDICRLCASPNNVTKTVKVWAEYAVRVKFVRNIHEIFGGACEVKTPGRPKWKDEEKLKLISKKSDTEWIQLSQYGI